MVLNSANANFIDHGHVLQNTCLVEQSKEDNLQEPYGTVRIRVTSDEIQSRMNQSMTPGCKDLFIQPL